MGLRIGIDARLVTYRRGMGNYVYYLLLAIADQQSDHDYYVYLDDRRAVASVPASPHFHPRVIRPHLEPIWEQVVLPQQIRRDRLDVLHATANTAPVFLPSRTALIVTIHDVMYLHPPAIVPFSPSRRQRLGRAYRSLIVPRAAKRARHILTVSEFSKHEIQDAFGCPDDKITVVPLAPAPHFKTEANSDRSGAKLVELGIEGRYVFALGAIDPRKNTERVIRAFSLAIAESKVQRRLVIAGLRASEVEHFKAIARDAGVAESTVFLNFVDEPTLVALYQHAEVLLYPSLYEGFGFPVLEAMACGVPVITSETTSLPELANGAAVMVNPIDTAAIRDALRQLFDDPERRAILVRRGLERTKEFSWKRVAQQVGAIYEEVGLSSDRS